MYVRTYVEAIPNPQTSTQSSKDVRTYVRTCTDQGPMTRIQRPETTYVVPGTRDPCPGSGWCWCWCWLRLVAAVIGRRDDHDDICCEPLARLRKSPCGQLVAHMHVTGDLEELLYPAVSRLSAPARIPTYGPHLRNLAERR